MRITFITIRSALLLHIIFAFAVQVNAQTIPKSIDKPVTAKPTKPVPKPVAKQKRKKEVVDDVDQKEKPEYLIPGSYNYMGFPNEGLTRVSLKNQKNGFVDKNNKVIIPFKYENVFDFSEGLAPVKLNGKWGYIDKKDNVVISF